MRTIDKRLFRMIKRTKGQLIAVMTVLIVGLVFFIAMSASATNLERAMHSYYAEYDFADLSCSVAQVTRQQIKEIEELPEIESAIGRITSTVPFHTDDEHNRAKVKIITINSGDMKINNLLLEEGNLLESGSREVLMINQFAESRSIHAGDEVTVQILGENRDFSVAGIVSSPEFVYLLANEQSFLPDDGNYGIVFMEEDYGRQLLGFGAFYNDIQMIETPGLSEQQRDDAIKKIDKILEGYGSKGVVKREDQFSNAMLNSEVDQLNNMASALPILFLAVAALIIAMMIGRMVKRDRQPIGIMKALGYSSADVLLHYVKYALLIGISGGIIGAVIGMASAGALSSYYTEFFNLPELAGVYDYSYMIYALVLSWVFCIGAGLWGAKGTLKISPAESMQAESPKRGKRIFIENLRFIWKRLKFSNKVALKNIFRNKKRTIFILAGVSVTFAMMVFVVAMPQMIDDMMGDGLKEYQSMDYNVSFERPVGEDAISDIQHYIDDVSAIEGKLDYPFMLSSGTRELNLSIIGVPEDTVFYKFKTKDGKELPLPKDGLLLTDYVASYLQVGVGDRVKVHSYLSDEDDIWMTVEGIAYQAIGTNAYMNASDMAKSYFVPRVITGVNMNTKDPDAEAELLRLPAVTSVISMATTMSVFEEYTGIVNASIMFMVVLAGVLGFAIIYNATIISIGERETEFSSLRVLGFSRLDIFRLILLENNLITVIGLVVGIPLTVAFLAYSSDVFSTEQYTMNIHADGESWLVGGICTIAFIALAQVATYRKIQRLDFLAALKNRA